MKGGAGEVSGSTCDKKTVYVMTGESFLADKCARVVQRGEIVTAAGVRGSRQPLLSLPF